MDTIFSNEDERKKLRKMVRSYQLNVIWILSLICIQWIIFSRLDKYPVLQIVLTVIIFVAMIYLLLSFALLKRCPRCSSWGTVPRGNCPKCGLYLDPARKNLETRVINKAHNKANTADEKSRAAD